MEVQRLKFGTLALICPVHVKDRLGYYCLERCISSFWSSCPGQYLLLLDDASPWEERLPWPQWIKQGALVRKFSQPGGLTRSWNAGLLWARDLGCRWAVAGNSDLVFSPGWAEPLAEAILAGAALAGPLTNAPGRTKNQGCQDVRCYLTDYRVSDAPEDIRQTAVQLRQRYRRQTRRCAVNGFCLFSSVENWLRGAYSPEEVFNPRYPLAGNEDELQKRWRQMGAWSAVCLDSFVFHYRSVTRGLKYASDGFFRPNLSEESVRDD